MRPEQNITHIKKQKLPLFIRFTVFQYRLIASKLSSVLCSTLVIIGSYITDCYYQQHLFVSGAGAITAAFGLILSIKHHYLKNMENIDSILRGYGSISSNPELDWNSPENTARTISYAIDEGVGIFLILVGSIVTYFSPVIPLIKIHPG